MYGSTVVKVLCYNRKVAGSIPAGVIGILVPPENSVTSSGIYNGPVIIKQ